MNFNNIYFKKLSELNNVELVECFNKFYPEKSKFLIKNWKWIYRVKLFDLYPLIMMQEKEMVGFAGSISTYITMHNNIKKAKWFVDFKIDKKKRNIGFGKILTQKWMEDDILCLTFCNNISLKIFKKFGWMETSPVYETRLVLNPLKFLPLVKYLNTSLIKNILNFTKSNINISIFKIKNNKKLLIELFNNHNKKKNDSMSVSRDLNWINWRLFESPFVDRYLFFKYKESFLIIDHFFLNNINKISVIFSSFNNNDDKNILLDGLLLWAKQNKIDTIWYVYMENNFFKKKLIKKTTKLNFAFYHKDLNTNQRFFDLQGLDGDNDLLFYNNSNIYN